MTDIISEPPQSNPFLPSGSDLKSSRDSIQPPTSQSPTEAFIQSIQKLKPSDFKFHECHLKEKINDHEDIPTDLPSAQVLLDVFKDTKITTEELDLWSNYSGYKLFESTESLEHPIKTIIDYCESTTASTSDGLKHKLRLITDKLKNNEVNRVGILILLAAHGGMCNVQKEVGVRMAYSFVTNSVKQEVEKQSLPTHVKKILKDLKETLTEKTYFDIYQNSVRNTHYLIPFRNELAPHIGLDVIPDPDPSFYQKFEENWLQVFLQNYTPESVIRCINNNLNDEPRRIPYEPFVDYLKNTFPNEVDSYEVLLEIFDEKGKVSNGAIIHMLKHIKILSSD
eukprot:TRINITY_DN8662_c0_g1_i1.p1 TRINITY_DN8662_c0_g1~~TRINITY_DN8662_c0_g1_i1.p1  ORF type:complete len:338 (+),score=57.45 TRINITY_DN8662_c0_g1_i1:156-1169(+)